MHQHVRETKGLDGSNPPLSAIQSEISAFSKGKSKIVRMLAHFLRPEGTGEAYIWPSVADLCSILSDENRAGALSPHRLPKDAFAGASPFGPPNRLFQRGLSDFEAKLAPDTGHGSANGPRQYQTSRIAFGGGERVFQPDSI